MPEHNDLRAVLQYIPQFRGRTFLVLIEAGLLPEPAVAESLLDLAVLEDLGVKLILGVLGGDLEDLYDWTLECEIRSARVPHRIGEADAVEETRAILQRGQSPVIDASGGSPLSAAVIGFARELRVSKVIALLEEAILIDGAPAHAIRAAEVPTLLERTDAAGAALLLDAAAACAVGVPRVHVLNGRRHGVLVAELFSNEGVGTMVHADSYREIRSLREEDVPELLAMIGRSVRRTRLVARTYEDIIARIGDYEVMSIDDNVVGCVALHGYPEESTAEIACLYVKQAHEGLGYGAELVRHVETIAQRQRLSRVFALTNGASQFFRNLGYREATRAELPPARRAKSEASGRESSVFFLDLLPPED